MISNPVHIAHVRATDQHIQTVSEHLSGYYYPTPEIVKSVPKQINPVSVDFTCH